MYEEKQNTAHSHIKKVTNLAIFTNILLAVTKFAIGSLSGSVALVADGVHSLADLITDFSVLLGIRLSSKKADKSHPYGHGRAETFSALFIALLLLFVALSMIYYAALDISKQKIVTPHIVVLAAALTSVIVKELLYRITKNIECS